MDAVDAHLHNKAIKKCSARYKSINSQMFNTSSGRTAVNRFNHKDGRSNLTSCNAVTPVLI